MKEVSRRKQPCCARAHLRIEPAASSEPREREREQDTRRRQVIDACPGAPHAADARDERFGDRLGLLADEVEGLLVGQSGAAAQMKDRIVMSVFCGFSPTRFPPENTSSKLGDRLGLLADEV